MDNDDAMVGRLFSRRRALALFGAAAGGVLAAREAAQAASSAPPGGLPTCVVRPAMTEGPYFVDEKLNRSDIRSDPSSKVVSAGVPLELTFLVSRVGSGVCAPLSGVMVDVWHCDALGRYSDVAGTQGQKFLRGYQMTDSRGMAKFTTVYPGWYPGRATHIHFKLRAANGTQEFTSQLFFDEKVTEAVYAQQPYAQKGTRGRVLNAQDGIYRNGGSQLLLAVARKGAGYAGTFDVGMNLR